MKKIIIKRKQILSTILVLILLVSNNHISLAINEKNEFSKTYLEQSPISVLQDIAQKATNDTEATAVYEELVNRVTNSQATSLSLIDTYFTHYYTITIGTSIYVYYRIKALVPSGAFLRVGYEYPASTRTSGGSISLSSKPTGTHQTVFSSKGLRCYSRTYASFSAYSYSEKKVYSTYLAFNTDSGNTYHTVTSADAIANKITLTAMGVFTTLSFPKGSYAYWSALIVSGLSISAIWDSSPGFSAGQYIELHTYYSSGRMYQRVKMWHNYMAYLYSYSNPTFDSISSVALPGF